MVLKVLERLKLKDVKAFEDNKVETEVILHALIFTVIC